MPRSLATSGLTGRSLLPPWVAKDIQRTELEARQLPRAEQCRQRDALPQGGREPRHHERADVGAPGVAHDDGTLPVPCVEKVTEDPREIRLPLRRACGRAPGIWVS